MSAGERRAALGIVRFCVWCLRAAALGVTIRHLLGGRSASRPVRFDVARDRGVRSTVSVVIPARNEEHRIGPCLESIVGAAGVDEVIVVDDGSVDATATVAARHGARVIAGTPLPAGWAGKAWALQQGIEAASGDLVVTLDADARASARLVPELRRRMEHSTQLLTVAGRFECPTSGSQWLHPALLTTLVYRFGRPEAPVSPERMLANGQGMALPRQAFLDAGGMTAVAGQLVEDVALARHLAGSGPVEFVAGEDLLTVRMFESFADTWRGWGRSIALPGVEPRHRQLADLARLGSVQALPVIRVALGCADHLDGAAMLLRLGTLVGTRRSYAGPGPVYWCSPIADPLAVARLALSIVKPSRRWRGRVYPAAP